jgi:hypothetical protein
MKEESTQERKRRGGKYRIIAEFLIGFICALAATGIYILVEKFM